MTKALLFSLGTCIVQIQSVQLDFACTKKIFQSLGRTNYQCPQCASMCQVRNILFEDQTNSFILSLGQGVYIFEENPKSVQDVVGDVYCPGKYCSNRGKCKSIGGYVTTPRSIYGCGKCGAWLFVQKVPFVLEEHEKTTKTDKTRFFSARKRWTWYPTNSYYLMSHFDEPNMERKNCAWTTKYERLSEMCIVQHVEMKSVFTLLFGGDGTHCFAKRRVATTKKKNHLHLWRNFSANNNQAHPNLNQKKVKWVQIWSKRINFLLSDDLSDIFIFQIISFNFNLQSTATQLAFNLQKLLIFSVSNDGIQWTLNFNPDSVTIAVIDLVQNITISSQEIPLAAWQLLLSQRQHLLDNHLPRVPVTQNRDGTMEMREEVLSSVGAQDMDPSSYQVSELEDKEFNWKNSQMDMDAVFRPGIDTPFSPKTFDGLSMEGSVENTIALDEEEDKENAVAPPSTPESVRPTEPPRLQRSRASGARMENVPDYVFRNLFQ